MCLPTAIQPMPYSPYSRAMTSPSPIQTEEKALHRDACKPVPGQTRLGHPDHTPDTTLPAQERVPSVLPSWATAAHGPYPTFLLPITPSPFGKHPTPASRM